MSVFGHGVEVCTSTTRPTPTEGSLIYETDTDTMLMWNGTGWKEILNSKEPNAMKLIQPTSVSGPGVTHSNGTISFTNSTYVNVNGVFSSKYKNYKLFYNGFGNTTGVSNVEFYWRSNNTNSTTNYYLRMWYYVSSGSFTTATTGPISQNPWQYVSNINNYWDMTIFNPAYSGYTGFTNHHDCWGTAQNLAGETHSWQYINAVYDGFGLVPIAANMSGTINIYGISNTV